MKRKKSKDLFALFSLALILLIAGEVSGIGPSWFFSLLMIIIFPGFLLSLFHVWNASGEEGDQPFMGY
jgi:asparagine N-glycosylation enzyme membrane subunit Stt3